MDIRSTATTRQSAPGDQPGPRRCPLPRLSTQEFRERPGAPGEPAIIDGGARDWPALRTWTPEFFKSRFSDLDVHVRLSLPDRGVPYLSPEKVHRRKLPLGRFIDLMEAGDRCYVDSDERHLLEPLVGDYRFEEFVSGERYSSLWLGARTRSGMHFDVMANLLAQVYGTKKAILASSEQIGAVYPFPDDITKSRVDPTAPDLLTYPAFASVVLFEGELQPGDLLSIPIGWWHFLEAPDTSISISCWHGPPMTVADHLRRIGQNGAPAILRFLRDFAVHGVLGRPYEQRLFCPPPIGKVCYDFCRAALSRRGLA